ncbi:hypothetical protein QOT17_017397 [Balamuthia mandrillaris]
MTEARRHGRCPPLFVEQPQLFRHVVQRCWKAIHGDAEETDAEVAVRRVEDKSKGFDHFVHLLHLYDPTASQAEEEDAVVVVLRCPRPSDKNPIMHRPSSQAWMTTLLAQQGVPVAKVLYLDPEDRFMVESFVGGMDLSELQKRASKQQLRGLFVELGRHVRGMHAVATRGFGAMTHSEENSSNASYRFQGKCNTWLEVIEPFFLHHLDSCWRQGRIREEERTQLRAMLERHRDYLSDFSDSRLLHADLNMDNIRVIQTKQEKPKNETREKEEEDEGKEQWKISGIIDFGDAMCGDPLYDFGEVLEEVGGDWELLLGMAEGYELFRSCEREEEKEKLLEVIRFYALVLCVWLLEWMEEKEEDEKGGALQKEDKVRYYIGCSVEEKRAVLLHLLR